MKILLCFPMKDGQTGPAIRDAFQDLGHHVAWVDAKTDPYASLHTAVAYKPDIIFCSRTEALAGPIKQIKKEIITKVCMWNVDTRRDISDWRHLFSLIYLCDYHFIVDSGLLSEWRKINPNTFCVYQGLQDHVYGEPDEITEQDKERFTCDVSWAGDLSSPIHKFRKPFIKAVNGMGIDFKYWGTHGKSKLYGENHNKMVHLSKINLACSALPENDDCVSVRDYKIMGAGGFLLELYREKIHDVFPEYTFGFYKNPSHLIEAIEFYLENDEIRKVMARQGQKWVQEKATYRNRMQEILKIMGFGDQE